MTTGRVITEATEPSNEHALIVAKAAALGIVPPQWLPPHERRVELNKLFSTAGLSIVTFRHEPGSLKWFLNGV